RPAAACGRTIAPSWRGSARAAASSSVDSSGSQYSRSHSRGTSISGSRLRFGRGSGERRPSTARTQEGPAPTAKPLVGRAIAPTEDAAGRYPSRHRRFAAVGTRPNLRWGPLTTSELFEEADVVVEVQAQVGDAVAQHGDPLDAHPEGEAGELFRVVAVLADVLEDVRVDHPGAEDLEPAGPLAQRAARAVGQVALRAVEARHVDL